MTCGFRLSGVSRVLVKVTLVLGPLFFVFWLVERGTVPWGPHVLYLSLGALILGGWLVTAGLDAIMHDYLREIESEQRSKQEAERDFQRRTTRAAKREAKRDEKRAAALAWRTQSRKIVYAVVDLRSSPDHPLGDAVETFVRREDAERFIEEVRGDDPELASNLRIEERELQAGGLN
jgi:hypothetical protein